MSSKKKNTAPEKQDLTTYEGFEAIYRAHYKMMLAVAYNQLRDIYIAEDLVHNIFLRLWEKREATQVEEMERYLIGAVQRAIMKYIRDNGTKFRHIVTLPSLPENTENTIDKEYAWNELQERVDEVVNQLPDQCQRVYKLSREDGKSNKEISSIMGIAEKTVESHMTKALKSLKGFLPEYNV